MSQVADGSDGSEHIVLTEELQCEIEQLHRNIMKDESRAWLLRKLLDYKLTTRDIYSFTLNQAMLRQEDDIIDARTSKAAMGMKIKDIKRTICRSRIELRQKEELLLKALNNKTFIHRKKLKSIRSKIRDERQEIRESYNQKIRHYLGTQVKMGQSATSMNGDLSQVGTKPTIPPRYLGEYSTLSVFGSAEAMTTRQKPLGPFICSDTIKLTQAEQRLLSRDPKFSLRYEPEQTHFSTEIERMGSKHRYNTHGKEKEERKKKYTDTIPMQIDLLDKYLNGSGDTESTLKQQAPDTNGLETTEYQLAKIFNENSDRKVFNPLSKTIDFSGRRPTDYKLNRHVFLPKSIDSLGEFECELRRREYMGVFNKYKQQMKSKKEDLRIEAKQNKRFFHKRKKRQKGVSVKNMKKNAPKSGVNSSEKEQGEKTGSMTSDKNKEKKSAKSNIGNEKKKKEKKNNPQNLSKEEIEALTQLKKKVKNGDLMIAQTDKSSRFAVLTLKQYLESGYSHTKKDKVSSWKEVKYLQGQVNSHVWWLNKILNNGKKTDPDRMMKNYQNHSMEIPEMSILIKDHKHWNRNSSEPVPSRPVVSGNKGINTHLSELLAEILEPISLEMPSVEISSTEEALNKISKYNEVVKNGENIEGLDILEDILSPQSILEDEQYDSNITARQSRDVNSRIEIENYNYEPRMSSENEIFQNEICTENDWVDIRDIEGLDEQDLPLLYSLDYLISGNELERLTPDCNLPARDKAENLAPDPNSFNGQDLNLIQAADSYSTFGDIPRKKFMGWDKENCDVEVKPKARKKISDYFRPHAKGTKDINVKEKKEADDTDIDPDKMNGRLRINKATLGKARTFNEGMANLVEATYEWSKAERLETAEIRKQSTSMEQEDKPPLQDFSDKPVMVAADVKALYPSIDKIGGAELAARAVRKSKISFKSIDFAMLSIYLFLVVGASGFRDAGLEKYTPMKNDRKS